MLPHRQLRYSVEIVDTGGFSQAVERLLIAQSALSRQVRDMEQATGRDVTRAVSNPISCNASHEY
ncbi:LysR family transcriptional regulator [Xenophilus sp. Marseille-Q4582]|uniref:helix-turn-helix domain-containing protein n=1 Tax=Xenophilus sp. Marseille-Q4582 TaxID=2866600 RepID=UPI001CE45064|nr:LysR family transcriptional regulator [Xenophilus sp. Marseille-Q4582]